MNYSFPWKQLGLVPPDDIARRSHHLPSTVAIRKPVTEGRQRAVSLLNDRDESDEAIGSRQGVSCTPNNSLAKLAI